MDSLLDILAVIAPLALAAFGAWMSISGVESKSRKQKTMILALFLVIGLLGSVITYWQQARDRTSHNKEVSDLNKAIKSLNTDLFQSQLSQEYMKGQLNAISLLIGKSGDKTVTALEKIAQSYSQTVAVSNKQICSNTMDLVKRMHKFARDRRDRSSSLSEQRMTAMRDARTKTKQEQDQIWQQYNALDTQRWSSDQYEFRTTILGEAVYLKDELLKRLPPQPKPDPIYSHVFEYGSLAGVYPEESAADYLERLTRKLCPQ